MHVKKESSSGHFIKQRIFDVIQISGGTDGASRAFDWIIIILILLSIVITTAQTFVLPDVWNRFLDVLDTVCMIAFTLEYVLRLWTADLLYPSSRHPYLKYLFSLSGLIDLFSFLPGSTYPPAFPDQPLSGSCLRDPERPAAEGLSDLCVLVSGFCADVLIFAPAVLCGA